MNIIIGQNESLPNIKGEFLIGSGADYARFNGGSGSGCLTPRLVSGNYIVSSQPYSTTNYVDGFNLDASEDGKVASYKDNAKVKPLTFTYKNWIRKF